MSTVLNPDEWFGRNNEPLRLAGGTFQELLAPDVTRTVSKVLRETASFAIDVSPIQPITRDLLYLHDLKFRKGLNELKIEDYDNDFLAPSNYAYKCAQDFMSAALKCFSVDLLIPYFVPDGEGGIRLEWVNGARELRLICPASGSKKPYLYHEDGDIYGVIEEVTDSVLREQLRWLIKS